MNTRELGRIGEAIAERYLIETMHARILDKNSTVRGGEIDIVAECEGVIMFVEVKMRRTSSGYDSVTPTKMRRLSLAATIYLQRHHLLDRTARFDVAIVHPPNDVDYIRNAFDYIPPYRRY